MSQRDKDQPGIDWDVIKGSPLEEHYRRMCEDEVFPEEYDSSEKKLPKTYSVQEVSKITNFCNETIRRQIRSGKLKAAGDGKNGSYRISEAELEKWWAKKGGGDLFKSSDEFPLSLLPAK